MNTKIKKTALALVAALVAGSASMAQAQEALDGTTGLRTEYYYAPLDQLARNGAPIGVRARQYLGEHPARSAGRVELQSGFDARAQVPVQPFDQGLGNGAFQPRYQLEQQFDASGAPIGPY